ncbi:hypothetical protein LshimejAT787_1200150 [Lyophyllum shimeji]|uniref:Uncharacterized protein n=1 Tax=Lyophyllum shimeji TaxID=47721 RepID=A0A9P3UTW0_LYOSH|nr:hypothetical protein LshimejAT787_1200150 [Lyophyllum shimeji]
MPSTPITEAEFQALMQRCSSLSLMEELQKQTPGSPRPIDIQNGPTSTAPVPAHLQPFLPLDVTTPTDLVACWGFEPSTFQSLRTSQSHSPAGDVWIGVFQEILERVEVSTAESRRLYAEMKARASKS